MSPARRALAAPAVLALELAVLVAAPALLAVAALLSPVLGGRRPLRAVAVLLAYCRLHVQASAACLALTPLARLAPATSRRAHYAVMRWFVAHVYATVERVARVHVVAAPGSEDADAALADRRTPVVLLSRHAGEGDSLLVLQHVLGVHGRRPRVVLHEALGLDPLIGMLGRRLPNRFVDPRGGDTEREIAAMAHGLGPDDAVVIFPEGGNFSAARRQRGIDRLERAGHAEEAAWARGMHHVTAPRPGGALAALAAAPDADVVVLGHHGVPRSFGEAWRLLPERQRITVRTWRHPASSLPQDPDARIHWLWDRWRELDAWVAEQDAAERA